MSAGPAKPSKGLQRRDWREVGFAALDFETTGLDLRRDHIISFGVVPIRAGRIVLGEGIHQLVRPPSPPSPSSITVHRMRSQDLAQAPLLGEAADALAGALAGRFLLTWYAPVELALLARVFGRAGRRIAKSCIDVRRLAVVAEESETSKTGSLSSCAERYGVPVAAPHEAFDDALVTAQLFLVLATLLRRRGIISVQALLRA